MLQAILAVLAVSGHGAAIADDAGVVGVGRGGSNADGMSSRQSAPAASWFHLDALDLNLYGLSYHPDREAVHRLNLDNQVNPGLGVHYELVNNPRGITFAEAGSYFDSGRNWAKFVALGYQFKWGKHWRIGGALAAMHSRTYNNGLIFVGMIPLLTYDLGAVKLNAVYFPKVASYNEIATYGFYISLPLGRWLQ